MTNPHVTISARCFEGIKGGKYYLVQTLQQFREFLALAKGQKLIAVDTETSGLNWVHSAVCGIVVGWGVAHNYYLAINHRTDEQQLNIDEIRADLNELFSDLSVSKIFANAKFDLHGLRKIGIEVPGIVHDIVTMAHILDENAEHGVKPLALMYVDPNADKYEKFISQWRTDEAKRRRSEFQEILKDKTLKMLKDPVALQRIASKFQLDLASTDSKTLKKMAQEVAKEDLSSSLCARNKKEDISYDYIPLEHITPYACADVHYTYLIFKELAIAIAKSSDTKMLYGQEMRLTRILFDTEHNGVKIDVDYLASIEPQFDVEIAQLEKAIYTAVGYEFNIASPVQLVSALQKAGVTLTKVSKASKEAASKGEDVPVKYAADKEVLEGLAATHPFASQILTYRNLEKTKNTYAIGIRELVDSENYVHPSFNQNVSTGRMSCTDPNCFDAETEVLTPTGWVKFPDLTKNEKVAQWNNGVIEFVRPTNYINSVASQFVSVKNTHINLVMTLDHRCLLRHRKTGEYRIFNAAEYPEDWQQLHAGVYDGPGDAAFTVEELILICAAQADGSWCSASSMEFVFKKPRKVARLLDCLSKLNAEYTVNTDSYERTRIRLMGAWAERLRNIIGTKKQFGDWILQLSRERLDQFCEEVFLWDGCATRMNHYSSNDRVNADWVQTALTLSGKRARIRKYQGKKNVNWQVDVTHKDYSLTNNVSKEIVKGQQSVYCVSVPSSYLIVRRGGEICVTGNCQNIPARDKTIRKAFITPGSEYLFVFFDYSQIELRLTADRSSDPTLLSCYPFDGEGRDVHTITLADVVLKKPIEEVNDMKKDKTGHTQTPPRGQLCRCSACRYDFYRNVAKRVNFGIIYGAGPHAIQRQVSKPSEIVPVEDCQDYINRYFEKYPGVKEWINSTQRFMKKHHYVQNTFGRYRQLKIDQTMPRWQIERACRQAVNFLIQGEAADLFKTAAIRVDEFLRKKNAKTRLVNFVHDEIQFYWHKDEIHLIKEVKHLMEDFDKYQVPIVAEMSYSPTDWSTKKELKV